MRCQSALGTTMAQSWSSLVRGDEGSNQPNSQTNLVTVLHALFLLFCDFINPTDNHLGRFDPSSPSSKDLHGRVHCGEN